MEHRETDTIIKRSRTLETLPSLSRLAHLANWYSLAHGTRDQKPFTPDLVSSFHCPMMYSMENTTTYGLVLLKYTSVKICNALSMFLFHLKLCKSVIEAEPVCSRRQFASGKINDQPVILCFYMIRKL